MSSTSNPRVQLIDSQGDPMDSPDDNALKVKLVDTDVEITVVADELEIHLSEATDDILMYGNDYEGSPANQKLKVDSSGLLYIKSIADTVEVVQDTPGDLTATVTQQSTARTVTCDTAGNLLATVTQNSAARTKAIAGTIDTGHQVSVGSSTTEIVDALGDRMAIIIVNDSNETIYLMLGASAILNRGIRLNADGGSFYTEIYQGVINGICASGSKNVTVTEVSP